MTETQTALLTAMDRCDRCGAQAYVKVQLPFGDLLFCGHHYTANAAALADTAISILDETHLIK